VSTSNSTITVIICTCIVVVTVYICIIYTSIFIAMEINAVIFVSIFDILVDTSNVTIARVFSASIIIVAYNFGISASYFWITVKFIAFVRVITTVRSISDYTSLIWVTFSIMSLSQWKSTQ
jgi:hypothetical protein